MDQRCINGPQPQRLPYPAAQVLGWLFECERTQISQLIRPVEASTLVEGASGVVFLVSTLQD